jgi:hypothetical protein
MKLFVNLLMILVGAAVGLVVGFALKSKPADALQLTRSGAPAKTNSVLPLKAESSFLSKRAARADDSPLATKLERDLSMSSGVTRWLYWLEAMEKATLADFPRLAQMARGNPALIRLVASRWIEMDPKHMFDTLASARNGADFPVSELQRLLLDEWVKRDIDAAIEAMKHSDGMWSRNWRNNFASSVVTKDVERGLRLMSEWNVDSYGPSMTPVKKWAAANPRHAAEFALAHPAGYATRLVMETVGKEWARSEPAAALEFAVSKHGEFASILASSVLKSWTERNLNEAADWLAKADSSARTRLSPAFVEAWAKYDAASALKWSEANLTGITFANAAAALVKGAGQTDLAGAAELVKSMGPSRARGEAASALMERWMPEDESKRVPAEAIAWLKGLDSESIKRVIEQVQWRWSEADPKSFGALISSLSPDQLSSSTYSTLARNMARENPTEALEWAGKLPEAHRLTAGNEVFGEWMRSQPEAARQWLNGLPPNDTRREPFFQNAVSTMAYDARGAEQLAAMTPAEQSAAKKYIEKMTLPEDRRTKLLEALKER